MGGAERLGAVGPPAHWKKEPPSTAAVAGVIDGPAAQVQVVS